jgi:hypothetical protein
VYGTVCLEPPNDDGTILPLLDCWKEKIDSRINTAEIGSMVGMKGECLWLGFLVLAVGYEVSAESSEVSSISFL